MSLFSYRNALFIAALLSPVLASGYAQACTYYTVTGKQVDIWDRANKGAGLVVNKIPGGATLCVREQHVSRQGVKWVKTEFFISQQIKYHARGWALATGLKLAGDNYVNASPARRPGKTSLASSLSPKAFLGQRWTLDAGRSRLGVMSVKKNRIVEAHTFRTMSGTISKKGKVQFTVPLSSISTGIDLRDVRMRFILFQTSKFATATVTASLDKARLASITRKGWVHYDLAFTLDFHGVKKGFTVPVMVTRIADDLVSVASLKSVMVAGKDFNLSEGFKKLSEAVNGIAITPVGPVSFNLLFRAAR